jgi:hypothetical protein
MGGSHKANAGENGRGKVMLNVEIMAGEPWIRCEDDYLREHLPSTPVGSIAVKLKRPEKGVRFRCKTLGLEIPDTREKFTARQDEIIQAEIDLAAQDKRRARWCLIAERLGVTVESVKGRARRLRQKPSLARYKAARERCPDGRDDCPEGMDWR